MAEPTPDALAPAKANKLPALAPGRAFHATAMDWSKAATMAAEVGFDCVEVRLGHNYLASSFLSPKINKRKDEYGGSLANRAKFARNIMRAVRDAVGDKIAIIAKLNMEDGVRSGINLEESAQTAQWLEQDGSLDALELTAGSSLLNPMHLFKGDAPLKEFASVMRHPVKLGIQLFGKWKLKTYPYHDLYLLGGVTNRQGMDKAMAEGFQFVAMGRALLYEPDLINRIVQDSSTKSKCMITIYSPKGAHCALLEQPS